MGRLISLQRLFAAGMISCTALAVLLTFAAPTPPAAAASTFGTSSAACSRILFAGTFPAKWTFLVGQPTSDTLKDRHPPRYRKIRQELDGPTIYGQVIDVSRVGGFTGAKNGSLEGHDRFVFVPWGVASDCGYRKWAYSYRWLPTDGDSFLWGRLRPPERWIEGIPTFDVHGGDVRILQMPPRHAERRVVLSPPELFALYARLPTREALDADAEAASAEVAAWQQENPELVSAFPATEHLTSLYDRAFRQYGPNIEHPFAGRYEWTLRIDGQIVRRTGAEIRMGVESDVSRWRRLRPPPYSAVPPEYFVRVAIPRSAADPPCVGRVWVGSAGETRPAPDAEPGANSVVKPGEYSASVDANLLARCLGSGREALMAWVLPLSDSVRGDGEHNGRLFVAGDGSVRFRQVLEGNGLPRVVIESVRLANGGA